MYKTVNFREFSLSRTVGQTSRVLSIDFCVTPEDTTPEDTTPEDTTPEDTTPEDTTPEDTTPEDITFFAASV
jgi:hypothetical protein